MIPRWLPAKYIASAHNWTQMPPETGAEIAFVGRSNAGKSTAINALLNHNRLAFVSKHPGRTQMINFFELRNGLIFADLPGYGFAKVNAELRHHWKEFLTRYLVERRTLKGLMLIMDIRHALQDSDIQMLEWFSGTGKPVHLILTKADKLSRMQAMKHLQVVQQWCKDNYPQGSAQLLSGLRKEGVEDTYKVIQSWLK
ncbi:MAG: ribosome biogenesis GTP-binding protein YihA/YsxC [Pseudomonadota bacterium]